MYIAAGENEAVLKVLSKPKRFTSIVPIGNNAVDVDVAVIFVVDEPSNLQTSNLPSSSSYDTPNEAELKFVVPIAFSISEKEEPTGNVCNIQRAILLEYFLTTRYNPLFDDVVLNHTEPATEPSG